MASLAHDLRIARRLIVRSPLFTTVVVATLAVAIGLNTAVYSAIDALMLRPLPGARHASEIVQLYRTWPGGMTWGSSSLPHYRDIRDRSGDTFAGVALWSFSPMNIAAGGTPQRVMGAMVSANFFSLLGVTPEEGRFFVPAEDTGRLAHRVAVVSHAAWQGIFGGDEQIVGRRITLNGQSYEVIGVSPPEFRGIITMVTPAIWVPLMQLGELRPDGDALWDRRGSNQFSIVARLRPGVTPDGARARMAQLIEELRAVYPDDYEQSGIALYTQSEAGIHPSFRSAQIGLSVVVMGVVAILLLIACVNVANLFLARARDRAREMAVRLSLGASRRALMRQLLVESLAFAVLSALVGLVIAQWAISLGNQIRLPFDVDFSAGMELSPSVLVFTVVTTTVAALLFGVAPALQATRPSLVPALKGEAPAGQSRSRMRSGLVVAQMALSIILLVSAGLFLRNLGAAMQVDKGFRSENMLIAEMDPGMQGYPRARTEDFYRQLRERLGADSRVTHVGFAESVPLGLGESDTGADIPGYTPRPDENMSVQYNTVTEGFFDAMGIPLTRGRPILATDDSTAQRVLVVNQAFVDKYFANREPIGATVRTRRRDHVIVGVVPTGKYVRLGEPATPFMYFSMHQAFESGRFLFVRTNDDPNRTVPAVRAAVAALDPTLPISNLKTMERHLGISLLPARLIGAVLGIFGLLGLGLAAIGMYGVMAYSVSQRTREIGIRMAIGASAPDVVRLVMRQGLVLVAIGAGVGLAGAFAASRALNGVLYGGGENDVATFVAVPLVLTAVAMLATWLPARRAASTDPLVALRQE